jgi:hypothetical protein
MEKGAAGRDKATKARMVITRANGIRIIILLSLAVFMEKI